MKSEPRTTAGLAANSRPLKARPLAVLLIVFFLISGACQAVTGRPLPNDDRTGSRPTVTLTQTVDQPAAITPSPSQLETGIERPPSPTVNTQPPQTNLASTSSATAEPVLPTITPGNTPTAPAAGDEGEDAAFSCTAVSPVTSGLLDQMTAETWLDWVEKLSGAEPVIIDGQETTITTRWSPSMFNGQSNARAFEFVLEQVQGWYPQEQIEVMDFIVTRQDTGEQYIWKNLILTLPGSNRPEEIVMLTAHLDSASNETPEETAPGAEDNGSGSATLLEAARLLKDAPFQRTVQIIWFTGEEQGLLGSKRFVDALEEPQAVAGVINLDMFGYDSDNDRCFEIHVGRLPQSDAVGQCFVQSIDAYDLELPQFDYLTDEAIGASDHSSFWEEGIGAIEILENMFDNDQPNGCTNGDQTPYYHSPGDTVDRLNPTTSVEIARAALAAVIGMAGLME